MTSSGIRRKMDDLGRVVIPASIRRALNIREGDAVEVAVEGERVVLSRPREACVFCGREDDHLPTYRSRRVCRECLAALGDLEAPMVGSSMPTDGVPDGVSNPRGAPGHDVTVDLRAVEPPRDRPIDGDELARRLAAAADARDPDGGHDEVADRDRDGAAGQDERTPARRPPHDPASTTAW